MGRWLTHFRSSASFIHEKLSSRIEIFIITNTDPLFKWYGSSGARYVRIERETLRGESSSTLQRLTDIKSRLAQEYEARLSREIDVPLLEELKTAGIPAEKLSHRAESEVPARYRGRLGFAVFTRHSDHWSLASLDETPVRRFHSLKALQSFVAKLRRTHPELPRRFKGTLDANQCLLKF